MTKAEMVAYLLKTNPAFSAKKLNRKTRDQLMLFYGKTLQSAVKPGQVAAK